VPVNITDTLTLIDYKSAQTSSFTNIRYIYSAVAPSIHLQLFQPIKHIRIVALSPKSLRIFPFKRNNIYLL